MYPNPSQTGGWNPNQTPPSSTAQPQQGQQQWAHPPQHSLNGQMQQPNGQYPQQRPQGQIPPITQGGPPQGPPMSTMQPQHPDQYRSLPPPGPMYAHSPYHPQPPIQYPPQPAPRQRTAIACRYCRRRKIRCSGFEHSEDGRCTNCSRFSQECIFTPVSHQTQAFVPAHSVLGRGQGQMPQQLYGAYGQPLPQGQYAYPAQYPPNGYAPYPPPPHMQQPQGSPMQQQGPGMAPPGQPPQSPAPGQQGQAAGQKRSNDEPHTPTQAPPPPGVQAQMAQGQPRSASASSGTSFQSAQPGQPYYPTPASQPGQQGQTNNNTPPHQNYTHEGQAKQDRPSSASPASQGAGAGGYPAPTSDPNVRPPQAGQDGTTPLPNGSVRSAKTNGISGTSSDGHTSSPAQHQPSPNIHAGKGQHHESNGYKDSADSDAGSQLKAVST